MHIVWDWNGTLLDDTEACIDALNEMLAKRGLEPITLDFYRRHFAFPVRSFYERIGVKLANEDWDRLAREYHDAYHARPARLARGTFAALDPLCKNRLGLEYERIERTVRKPPR